MINLEGPFKGHTFSQNMDKQILGTVIMWLLVIFAAIGVVYCKHASRIMHAKLQVLHAETITLQNERGKLLLEQATWTSDAHVEQVARKQLNMIAPTKVEMIKP